VERHRSNAPIEELNLTVRAYNRLKRGGITTIAAVLERSDEELLAMPGFSPRLYDELRSKLISNGFLDN
jgi:DNA-directed RNA polymerase subunit alpha